MNAEIMKGFRLLNFKMYGLKNYEKFEYVPFIFSERDTIVSDFPFVTLVIGTNTSGKSRLLRILTEIFNDLYKLREDGAKNFSFKGGYKIEYAIQNHIFIVANDKDQLIIQKNNQSCEIEDLLLPEKLIATSYSINDRFPHQSNTYSNLRTGPNKLLARTRYDNSFYEYLGIRTFNNMASASGHITRTIDLLFNAMLNNNLNDSLIEVFNVLDFRPQLSIGYRLKNYKSILGRERLSKEYVIDFIKNLDERKTGFAYKTFQELLQNENIIEELVEYAEKIKHQKRFGSPFIFDLDFTDVASFALFSSEYKMLTLLRKLNLISYNEITVNRNDGSRFDINKGSSGEINLFTSFISLACVIEDNSLILIDEPEISLHPNWQLKYLDLLNEIFQSRYSNAHFIICSHSHFLVSDLRPESSNILALKKDLENKLIASFLNKETYGWSAEQVLLEVFGVATTRNYFIADKIGEILELLASKDRDALEIQLKVNELLNQNVIVLSKNDPLYEIWSKIVEKYA